MDVIYYYNRDRANELLQWYSYLNKLQDYVSNRVIAWDYNNRHTRLPNGTCLITDFDYNIGYAIKTNKGSDYTYVYIFMLNLKLDEFGLKVPHINGNTNRMIKNALNKRLYYEPSQKLNEYIEYENAIKKNYLYNGLLKSKTRITKTQLKQIINEWIELLHHRSVPTRRKKTFRLSEVNKRMSAPGSINEMARVRQAKSGLPMLVWLSPDDGTNTGKHKMPRIKFQDNTNTRLIPEALVPISIHPTRPTILLHDYRTNLPASAIAQLQSWVIKNYDTLMAYWNNEIYEDELIERLK
mgnify:CR=1 FL=1